MEKKFALLFKNLCCSRCKSDFDENSVIIMHDDQKKENSLKVIKLICQNCGKSFGIAFLGVNEKNIKDEPLKDIKDTSAITKDEVLDAHEYIKDFETHWKNYIEDKNNN
ncbi:MAG: hypothetical protein DKM22_00130 [Candidatus Melainabacteria bacterium]|nr:MAG: hypothetical protein DKM22_00130 [Candidatus Melainabacteria bacterium]